MPAVQTMVARVFSAAARATAALLFSSAALLLPSAALAQPSPKGPSEDPSKAEDPAKATLSDDDDLGPGRTLPRDDRKGRFSAFAGASLVVPGGDLGAGVTFGQIASFGYGADLGVAVGLTRYAGLELRGQYINLSASSDCADCKGQMFVAGLGLTYHAAQALGFDPWVRFGFGYRGLTLEGTLPEVAGPGPGVGMFHGIDVTNLALGGDFFPVPWLGLGLYLAGDVGIQASAPSPEARGAVYGLFQFGLRIAIEPQRKAVTAASSGPRPAPVVAKYSDPGPALYNRAAQ